MMISYLPSDLIEEILLRVPAKSLGRLQFTCKRWNALVENPRFIKKHFDKAPRQSLIVTQMHYRVYSTSFNLHGIHNNVDPFIEFTRKLSLMYPRHHHNSEACISQVFHCEGLLLCITMDELLAVWNPCTGQTMWLKPREPYERSNTYALGYTNNKLCRSYKILRHFTFTRRMEIYEFCSNSWRDLDDDPKCNIHTCGVSLKGHIYWLAYKSGNYSILRFDFSTEKFRLLPLPPKDGLGNPSLAVVREEQLSLLRWSLYTREIKIWVSTKIETTNVSWSNFLKVSLSNIPCLNQDARFYIDYDKKVVVYCNLHGDWRLTTTSVYIIGKEEHIFREISLGESPELFRWPITFSYVPSLVRFQEGIVTSGHKRKRT